LLVSPADALVAPLTEAGARLVDPGYRVLATCNWYFMAASTVMLTLVGWWVTSRITEPRVKAANGSTPIGPADTNELVGAELRALLWTLLATVVTLGGLAALLLIPGAPLHGYPPRASTTVLPSPRWASAIVPLIFVAFLVPGIVYGVLTRTVRSTADVSAAFVYAMSSMAPM